MTILPSQINDVLRLYTNIARASSGGYDRPVRDVEEPRDIISISVEGKKRQVMEQTKQEVLRKIKETVR